MDEPRTASDDMLRTANDAGTARRDPRSTRHLAFGVLRTTGMLVLATLAILVLLPAMIAAQPTFLG